MKPSKFYLFFLLLLTVACISAREAISPGDSACYVKKEFSFKAQEPVRGELDRVNHPAASACYTTAREHSDPSEMIQLVTDRMAVVHSKNTKTIAASRQKKDYLSHIYPSHNFW